MPTLDNEKIIKMYWEEEKHKYPDMSFEQFRLICKAPFEFYKILIKGEQFVRILVKFLGKFTIYPGRIVTLLKRNLSIRCYGGRTQERYLEVRDYYLNILNEVKYEYQNDDQEGAEESEPD